MGEAIVVKRGNDFVTITFENYKVYGDTSTRTTPKALSVARNWLAGASVGDYALFAGGSGSSVVDAYDTELARTTPTALSVARDRLAGTSVGDYALFAGGYTGSYSSVVDAYDTELARTTPTALSVERQFLAGTSVGDYALFAGGYTGSGSASSVVDAYTFLGARMSIPITAGSKYKLNSTTETTATTNTVIKVSSPITGYIKYKGGKFE